MQVQAHFTFHTEEEFMAFAKKYVDKHGSLPVNVPTAASVLSGAEKVEAPKPTKKTAEKAPNPEPVKEEAAELETHSSEPVAFTFDNVKEAVLTVSRKKGRDAAIEVLAKFGAKKVGPELKETDYGAVVEECNKVLAA